MDPQELQKNIALYYSKLSPKLQEFFSSMKWLETLSQIGAKYALNEDQNKSLGTETTLALLGIISLSEYEETLKKELALPKENEDKVLEEINNNVLSGVREEVSQTFDANVKTETPEEQKTEEKLDARFEQLPDLAKKAINKSNYQEAFYAIAKKYELNVIQMGSLEKVIVDLITGIIHSDGLEDSLKKNLELPAEKINQIANDINEKILKEIRKNMIGETRDVNYVENREDMLQKIEQPELINASAPTSKPVTPQEENQSHPILVQKLSGPVQSTTVKTEHTLDNITKTAPPASPSVKIPIRDPYRELPE